MILIEQDAKRLLMERLDECLKVHADMLDAQNIGSIYELQGLSELHYYLKVEHVFTPAEVEALLSFQDPLDVARWCWEEITMNIVSRSAIFSKKLMQSKNLNISQANLPHRTNIHS